MKRLLLTPLIIILAVSITKTGYASDTSAVLGRWDITVTLSGKEYPSWLEVKRSGSRFLVGEFVGPTGSARPISQVNLQDGKLSFSIPPQWEGGSNNLNFEATLRGDSMVGSIIFPDGKNCKCSAVRAPALIRSTKPVWDKPIQLFNGKDLKGWHASETTNQWIVENGILKSPRAGSNLISDALFTDFKLQVKFRFKEHGNSGIYLRGRYEVQITDYYRETPVKDMLGSIYGFIAPAGNAGKKPGEWQTYEITLIGRMVTVVLNGTTIICNQEIPGITGGALNSKEGTAGPIMLQGDHEPIEYGSIVITPAK